MVFPKGQSSWVAKPIREKKPYDFLYHLIKDVMKTHTHGIQDLPSVAAPLAKDIASKPKPDKKAVVDQHISRFNNMFGLECPFNLRKKKKMFQKKQREMVKEI